MNHLNGSDEPLYNYCNAEYIINIPIITSFVY